MIHVAMCVDKDYLRFTKSVINSIKANTEDDVKFHLINADLPIGTLNYGCMKVHRINPLGLHITGAGSVKSEAQFYRWLIPDLIKTDKCIYIEPDCVFNGDIAKLWSMDLGDNYVGACKDYFHELVKTTQFFQGTIPIEHHNYDAYLSGLLVMNLKRWREGRLKERLIEYQAKHSTLDMITLNVVCAGQIKEIDPSWQIPANRELTGKLEKYSRMEFNGAHWSGKNKPWNRGTLNREKWEEYAQ